MGPGPLKYGRPSRDRRRSTVARCGSWTSACVPWTRASRSRSPSRKAVSASSGGSRRRWTSRSSGCTGYPTDRCGWEDWRRASIGGSPRTKSRPASDYMDLRDRTVMILGGSGLVGHAVARRLLGAAPRRVVLVALFEEEVRATARALEPHRGRATIEVEWGNVFLPASLARLERGSVMANPEHRRLMLQDLLSDLTDDVCHRSYLYQLLLKYEPDAVVDSINTATAFAYQDALGSAPALLRRSRSSPRPPSPGARLASGRSAARASRSRWWIARRRWSWRRRSAPTRLPGASSASRSRACSSTWGRTACSPRTSSRPSRRSARWSSSRRRKSPTTP